MAPRVRKGVRTLSGLCLSSTWFSTQREKQLLTESGNANGVCQLPTWEVARRKEKREATAEEAALIAQADAMRDDIVQVNVFDKHGPLEQGIEGYERPAIAQTKAWIDGKHFDGGDFEMYEAQEIADPTAAGKAATA